MTTPSPARRARQGVPQSRRRLRFLPGFIPTPTPAVDLYAPFAATSAGHCAVATGRPSVTTSPKTDTTGLFADNIRTIPARPALHSCPKWPRKPPVHPTSQDLQLAAPPSVRTARPRLLNHVDGRRGGATIAPRFTAGGLFPEFTTRTFRIVSPSATPYHASFFAARPYHNPASRRKIRELLGNRSLGGTTSLP